MSQRVFLHLKQIPVFWYLNESINLFNLDICFICITIVLLKGIKHCYAYQGYQTYEIVHLKCEITTDKKRDRGSHVECWIGCCPLEFSPFQFSKFSFEQKKQTPSLLSFICTYTKIMYHQAHFVPILTNKYGT